MGHRASYSLGSSNGKKEEGVNDDEYRGRHYGD